MIANTPFSFTNSENGVFLLDNFAILRVARKDAFTKKAQRYVENRNGRRLNHLKGGCAG